MAVPGQVWPQARARWSGLEQLPGVPPLQQWPVDGLELQARAGRQGVAWAMTYGPWLNAEGREQCGASGQWPQEEAVGCPGGGGYWGIWELGWDWRAGEAHLHGTRFKRREEAGQGERA